MLNRSISSFVVFSAIVVSGAIFIISNPANAGPRAGSRYGTPPPVVLSPDLTAPWVLQLRNPPAASLAQRSSPNYSKKYRVQLAKPVVRTRLVARSYAYKRSQPANQPFPRRTVTATYSAPKPAPGAGQHRASVQTAKPRRQMDAKFEPQIVSYSTNKSPGTIIIDTNDKFLYLLMDNGQARRYGVGVGKPGFEWAGTHKISRKAEWPAWRPPAQMIAREKKKGRILPAYVEGGPENPLGARALYLGSTLYRIHGTSSPWTIGKAVSSGCIRMRNEDVMDLYERVGVGTKVIVS